MRVLYRRRDDGLRSSAWHDSSRGASSGAPTRHSRGSSTDGRSGADPSYRRPLLKASVQPPGQHGMSHSGCLRTVPTACAARAAHPISTSNSGESSGPGTPGRACRTVLVLTRHDAGPTSPPIECKGKRHSDITMARCARRTVAPSTRPTASRSRSSGSVVKKSTANLSSTPGRHGDSSAETVGMLGATIARPVARWNRVSDTTRTRRRCSSRVSVR